MNNNTEKQDINLIQTTLANSIENATKLIIKEKRRTAFLGFIVKLILFIIIFGIIISFISNNENSSLVNTSSINDKESHVALVSIRGEIAADSSNSAELINSSMKKAFENDNSVAIILKINSPGGSPVQAGMVYDEIKRLRKAYPKKKIYAAIEDICASGGYYIAAATDAIYADKASIVGSIGVIMEGFGFDKIINNFGVKRRLYTSGENKAMLDPFVAEQPNQVAYIKSMITNIHTQFITAVKNGRGIRLKEDKNTFSGMIWTGEEAIKNGIIDGLYSAENLSRNIIKNTNIIDYTIEEGLANRLAKKFGTSITQEIISKARNLSIQ